MFPSMIYQIHIDYVKEHHYIAIVPLITEKRNIEFIEELKGSHGQENLLFKIDYWIEERFTRVLQTSKLCNHYTYIEIQRMR
jgi:hypothetical protein